MRIILSVLIVLNFSVAFASDLRRQVLPPSLAALQFLKDTPATVEKSLGAPKRKDKKGEYSFYFYNTYGLDYDTVLIFKKQKLLKLSVTYPGAKFKYSEISRFFTQKDLDKATEDMFSQTSHDAGMFLDIMKLQEGFHGRFRNLSEKFLVEAVFWKEGTAAP